MNSYLRWASRKEVAVRADGVMAAALPVLGIVAALIAGGLVILVAGKNPLVAYAELTEGAFGGIGEIAAGLNRSTPYLLAGLGFALAFRAGAFNIGGEGQIALGGLASTAFALAFPGLPALLLIPLALLVGALAGGAWAGIAAAIKLTRGVHEVIVTLLMNFVAILIVHEMLTGPLEQPGMGFPQSPMLPTSAWLPQLIVGTGLHAGVILAVALALIAYVLLWRTSWGFEIRVLGQSPAAARYAGVHAERAFAQVMVISGMLGGLAGAVEILGIHYRLLEGFSEGFGFDAIAVALIGGSNPMGVVPASLFFGFLQSGAASMQRAVGIPSSIVPVIQGLAIIFVMVSFTVRFRIGASRRQPEGKAHEAEHSQSGAKAEHHGA